MAPLRILYVVSRWGEPTQTFVRREVDAALAAGHEVVVLSLKPPVPSTRPDVPVHHLGRLPIATLLVAVLRHPLRSGRALVRAARRSRPATVGPNLVAVGLGTAAAGHLPDVDWIHAHFAWVAASAADGVAAVRRRPFSVFAHAHDVFDDRVVDGYTGDKLRRAAFVAVESDSIRAEVDGRFGCRTSVVRMGVPPGLVAADPSTRAAEPQLVVTVGSLLPKKGHDVLLRALARLAPDVRLAVGGSGPEQTPLERLADELGLGERVEWLGSLPETHVVEVLDRAAVFCLASRPTPTGDRDGVPNVLIEAMARGVPCVSTAVTGIPDLLADGRGVVVGPDDPDGLAAALTTLLDDPGRAAALGRASREHVVEYYRTDRNWTVLEDLIHSRLERPDVSLQATAACSAVASRGAITSTE